MRFTRANFGTTRQWYRLGAMPVSGRQRGALRRHASIVTNRQTSGLGQSGNVP
jgi:hypothetical protein